LGQLEQALPPFQLLVATRFGSPNAVRPWHWHWHASVMSFTSETVTDAATTRSMPCHGPMELLLRHLCQGRPSFGMRDAFAHSSVVEYGSQSDLLATISAFAQHNSQSAQCC
jgi:hypothetical protein